LVHITIPGKGEFHLRHLVLDVNGTVAVGGRLIDGLPQRLQALRGGGLEIHWITADTRGCQAALDAEMGWPAERIAGAGPGGEPAQKAAFVRKLGAGHVVAIGNGANDVAMLREAALGIAVLGGEGLAVEALLAADLVAPGIHAALELLEDPNRLIATLRR
jgi:P-type E1-E2 ATPase